MQPDPTSPLDLDALKALCDAATPGPWYRAKNHSRSRVADPDNAIGAFAGPHTRYLAVVGDGGCHGDTDAKSDADAEFIAAAREAVPALLAALAEAQRREKELRGARIVSVVFGHHKGAPRPFALRVPGERDPRYLGAQWPDGFVVLQGPNGGAMPWRSVEDMLADFDGVEIVWLSDELEPLAEMEQQRDAARATVERMRREIADAGWSSVADLHAAYVDVLGRWQRAEPVVEAARAWYAACDPGAISAPDVRAAGLALAAAVDTYETREGTG